MEIVNKYSKSISQIISEPDQGMYDAINKGIEIAKGEVIAILNSDDFYVNPKVISEVMKTFESDGVDSVYGDLLYVDYSDTSKVVRYWQSGEFKPTKFLYGWMPPHPAFFVRKNVYKKLGRFNLNLKSAADYELMLRFLLKNRISTSYLKKVLVKMRVGGMSNSSLKNRIRANKEDRKAWEINELKPYSFTLYLKPLRKVFQFIKKG